jgi:hypothetical protein
VRTAARSLIYPTRAELLIPHLKGLSAAERLLARYVVEPNGCWRWTRGITTVGYAHLSIQSVYYQAHRLMYILLIGPFPEGLEPDHTCRNRACVNPWHIEPVTHDVNMQRGSRARLTETKVAAIRSAHVSGAGVRALARLYGVNHSTVSRIVNGLIWPEPEQAEAVA